MKTKLSRQNLLLLAFLLLLVVFGALVVRKFLGTTPKGGRPASVAETPAAEREVLLYFAAKDAAYLVAESRQIPDCLEETECLMETVQALVDGPVGDLAPIFPSHAQVRGVVVEEGVAVVDFSPEVAAGHPGGSMSELLTVYGLADTLAVNFPHIRQVRILVEGKEIPTLKGHVDLREPVKADFRFARDPSGAQAPRAGE